MSYSLDEVNDVALDGEQTLAQKAQKQLAVRVLELNNATRKLESDLEFITGSEVNFDATYSQQFDGKQVEFYNDDRTRVVTIALLRE